MIGIQQDGELVNRGQVTRQVGVGEHRGEDADREQDRKNVAESQPRGAEARLGAAAQVRAAFAAAVDDFGQVGHLVL